MKLNREGRNDYRKAMDAFLDTIEFNPNNRITMKVEDLEELLFDEVVDKNGTHKEIGFFSKNLCKLDLSKVSFENVDFSTEDDKIKDFSNTNINISFSKCYISGIGFIQHGIAFYNTNFENVNLSNNDLVKESDTVSIDFHNCNLKSTQLYFKYADRHNGETVSFTNCDLSNNNLSDGLINCDYDYHYGSWGIYKFSSECIFKNTGMLFCILEECTKEDVRNLLANGKIEGCDISIQIVDPETERTYWTKNVCVKTEEQRKQEAKTKKEEYDAYKKEYIMKKLEYVRKQVYPNKKN